MGVRVVLWCWWVGRTVRRLVPHGLSVSVLAWTRSYVAASGSGRRVRSGPTSSTLRMRELVLHWMRERVSVTSGAAERYYNYEYTFLDDAALPGAKLATREIM